MGEEFDKESTELLWDAIGVFATDSIKHLVDSGADVNARNSCGNTPLHEAAARGQVKAIAVLLDHGANPIACNAAGQMPWEEAAARNHVEAARMLEREAIHAKSLLSFVKEGPQQVSHVERVADGKTAPDRTRKWWQWWLENKLKKQRRPWQIGD